MTPAVDDDAPDPPVWNSLLIPENIFVIAELSFLPRSEPAACWPEGLLPAALARSEPPVLAPGAYGFVEPLSEAGE